MAADALDFTFNTSLFEKGISRVMRGFSSMENTASNVSRGVTRGLTRVVAVIGSVYGAFRLVRGALSNIPEVGQVFGITRDIFVRNFLFPLRKEILPLLQRWLDWARDNRAAFVRWGNVLANIFRAVVRGVRTVVSSIRRMSTQIADFAARIFGDQIRNIEDTFNLITFKLAVVIQFVSQLVSSVGSLIGDFFGGLGDDIGLNLSSIVNHLKDFVAIFTQTNQSGDSFGNVLSTLADLLGRIADFVIRMVDKFLEGFVPAISEMATPIQRMADALSSIFESIFGSTEAIEKWEDIFRSVGEYLGKFLLETLNLIAGALEFIADPAESIRQGRGIGGEVRGQGGGRWENGRLVVDDAILRPDGTIVQTNPRDTLVAIKDPATSLAGLTQNTTERNFQVSIDFTGMNVVLQQGGAEQGQEFAMGLIEQVRDAWNSEFERFGG